MVEMGQHFCKKNPPAPSGAREIFVGLFWHEIIFAQFSDFFPGAQHPLSPKHPWGLDQITRATSYYQLGLSDKYLFNIRYGAALYKLYIECWSCPNYGAASAGYVLLCHCLCLGYTDIDIAQILKTVLKL
jgi:hypothetical protein